jgi:hypothetical protein
MVLVVVAVTSVLLVTRRSPSGQAPAASEATTTTAGPPLRVERLDHRPGDCLTWDQGATGDPTRTVATVDCERTHLVEVTGHLTLTDDLGHAATDAELDRLTADRCRPVDEAHLGGPLDPHGRYYSAGIQPSVEGWRDGDREVWCALGARDGTESGDGRPAGRHRPFTGRVTAAAQFWRYERGQCLAAGRRAPVPCSAEHEVEFTGQVPVPDGTTVPALDDIDGWDGLIGEACRAHAQAYLERDTGEPLTAGWLGVDPESWRAGDRTAHCLVGERDPAGGWLTVRGSARALPT